MRLNRFLARAGVASRRKCDTLIQEGAVQVNGRVVREPGSTVAAERDVVICQDREIALPRKFQYIVVHKATGCLVTRSDTHGRPTIFEQVSGLHPGTVAVGRLDLDASGVLLLTDDGDLVYRLAHPRFEVQKRYEVVVWGRPSRTSVERLRRGLVLEDGPAAPAWVRVLSGGQAMETRLEVRIHEGRKHQVKRMCQAVGHRVKTLRRIRFAGLTLQGLKPGEWRRLRGPEVRHLRALVGLGRQRPHRR